MTNVFRIGAGVASLFLAAAAFAAPADQDIVDTAVSAGSFKTLVAAVKAAGLVDTLKGPGPFTVFAPTDEAFAKLPARTVEELLKPENKSKLVAVLTYPKALGVGCVRMNSVRTLFRTKRVPFCLTFHLQNASQLRGLPVTLVAVSRLG